MKFTIMTYDVITIGLIISWVLIALWAGRVSWKHHDDLHHARMVGLGCKPVDERMKKLGRWAVHKEQFEIGQILASRRKRPPTKPYIKGIPKHLQQ